EALDVGVGWIALIGGRLHHGDRQRDEQHGPSAEGFAVSREDRPAVFLDLRRQPIELRTLCLAHLGGREPDRARGDLLAPDCLLLCHQAPRTRFRLKGGRYTIVVYSGGIRNS